MRKIRSISRIILLSALVAGSGIRVATAATPLAYHVTDLGTLGGTQSAGVGINASGQVTGYANITGDAFQLAFLWKPTAANGVSGTMQNLGTQGGTFVDGQGINDSGQIAGSAYPPEDTSVDAFVWTPTTPNGTSGTMHNLGTLDGEFSYGYGINARGQVTGISHTIDGRLRAFLWTPTTPNSASGSMIDLGTLGGEYYSAGWGINASGQVTGEANTSGDTATHAFLYDDTMHDLGTLGGTTSAGYDINASGQIVGYSQITRNAAEHAFLYTSGSGMVDLNTLIDPLLDWELRVAPGINDVGQITGYGQIGSEEHAFLLTPVPEPASLALLALGIPFLIWRNSRKELLQQERRIS